MFLASHSLRYFYIGITPEVNLPEFSVVGLVDGEQIVYYDSNVKEMIPKNEWIKEVDADKPDYWNMETQKIQGSQDVMTGNLATVMERFNHSGGGGSVVVTVGAVVVVLLLALTGCIGLFMWKKKQRIKSSLLSVTGGSQTLLTLVAEPGDDVTIWSNHALEEPAHIFWFKHTNESVPDLLTCLYYKMYSSPAPCSFIPQSSRMVMTVNSEKMSLNITGVNYTDSGLYYCCIQRMNYMTFSNATFLLVRDLFFMLTVVFSAVMVILLSALIIILKGRKPCRDEAGSTVEEEKEEQDCDLLKFVPLQFSERKMKRPGGQSEEVETCVQYSIVRPA
ncbi:hypothetical protein MHYP_G00262190 [Metynnis hypsauchen]